MCDKDEAVVGDRSDLKLNAVFRSESELLIGRFGNDDDRFIFLSEDKVFVSVACSIVVDIEWQVLIRGITELSAQLCCYWNSSSRAVDMANVVLIEQ